MKISSGYVPPTKSFLYLTLAILTSWMIGTASAAPAGKPGKAWKKVVSGGGLDQDFPFQNACIGAPSPARNVANKGIALKLGNDAYVCFDTDLLRVSAGWTGKYLNLEGVAFSGSHGSHPTIAGEQKFGTKALPGFSDARGAFKDSRPEPFGPVPASQGRWNGLYLNGDDVVFSYTALGNHILEHDSSVAAEGEIAFVRTFKIEKIKQAVVFNLCDVDGATGEVKLAQASLKTADRVTLANVVNAPAGVSLEIQENSRILLRASKGTPAATFSVVIWSGATTNQAKIAGAFKTSPAMPESKGGPAHWPEYVVTKGALNFNSNPDGSYVVDQLTPPTENPWNRRVRFGGLDFFSDGKRAALCTWDGDVWIVSGIDENLEKLTWKRFASGSYETLGLKIVDDVIYTSGRDQITRYHDLNKDGEADFYENFNNEITSSEGFHEFVFDLQTDTKGNFFVAKAGPVRGGGRGFGGDGFGTISAHAGTLLKISKDGRNVEVYATGFRAPNGISVGPNNEVTTGDNEGTWVPACPINWVEKNGFYGVEPLAHQKSVPKFQPPLCWMSHNDIDNSGGGQAWVTSKKWGPMEGELLHMSYGKCALYHVLKEKVGTQMQGGVVKIPLKFTSSTMRAKFNPKDGQLYVTGLQGWQTSAAKITGLDRVRYTGKPVYAVSGLKVKKNAIELVFTQPLDPVYASDVQNYSAKRWNYQRAEDYGSPEFSVSDPQKKQRDELPIKSAKLSADGKTVTLEIADLKPVMGQSINFNLKAKDGTEINQVIQHTINAIP